jgi:hypothetical protein
MIDRWDWWRCGPYPAATPSPRRIASGEWSPERGGSEILYLVHDEERAAQERMAAAILARTEHGRAHDAV